VLGTVLSVAAVAVPFALSVAAAVTAGRVVPHRHGLINQGLWWEAVLAASMLAFLGADRLCRRLLPLAALLKMTMLFPDRAPKRLKVAWRAGLTRDLERRARSDVAGDGARPSVPSSVAEEILSLAASLSRHDRKTRGHSERVRAFTDMIADELHLPLADRDRLRWSALLHDVGKLSVHPHILNKESKLDEEEWKEIRSHPLEGRRLIAPLAAWLGPWSLTIEQHHENYDGSGYPFGLSGDQLSLGARIVSVADAYEVITAGRSYKKPLSAVAAREELTRCAGSQFDPAIVRAFLNVSIGRLRWTIGPVSWLADVPILTRLGMAGHAVAAGAQVALGAAALTVGAVAAHASVLPAASVPAPRPIAAHGPVALAPTTTSTTVAAATTSTAPPAPRATSGRVAASRTTRTTLAHHRKTKAKPSPATKNKRARTRLSVRASVDRHRPALKTRPAPSTTARSPAPRSPAPRSPAPRSPATAPVTSLAPLTALSAPATAIPSATTEPVTTAAPPAAEGTTKALVIATTAPPTTPARTTPARTAQPGPPQPGPPLPGPPSRSSPGLRRPSQRHRGP
jgi:HD-GYP domain-containing protein (c-di-GMP phosphodiesterase class II)